jgi:hypothetical protein
MDGLQKRLNVYEATCARARSGAMVARAWSGLMCLETQGTRGGRQTLDLDGAVESLTHDWQNSTCVSEVPRWACRWRRSASRCLPDGHSGRDVGMGTGVADGPEVGRAGRRPGLKNMGPSAGRVGALGGSRETRRNSNFDRVASFKFPPLFSTSATLKPVRFPPWSPLQTRSRRRRGRRRRDWRDLGVPFPCAIG